MNSRHFDFIIIGSGIVGLSVAYEIVKRNAKAKIAILEKESKIGVHASGRNSGVLHSGIFYREDSLKAKVCALGAERMKIFANLYDIPFVNGGKVIVPTSEEDEKTLEVLMNNARQNKIPAELIDTKTLLRYEPFAFPAKKSIFCSTTSVIDNMALLNALKKELISKSVDFLHNCKVLDVLSLQKKVQTTLGQYSYEFLINCAGGYADQIAKMEGLARDYTLLPFKGIYYKLSAEAASKVKSNIYPVPNIATPFLGVHFTRSIHNDVYIGPTAIPVFGRENYQRLQGISISEASELSLQLLNLFIKNNNNFRTIAKNEMMKYSKKIFYQDAKKLLPSLKINDLLPSLKAGIRPQLMNKKTKALEMDFIFEKTDSSIHVLNAISPAFTSSFAFAEMIMDQTNLF